MIFKGKHMSTDADLKRCIAKVEDAISYAMVNLDEDDFETLCRMYYGIFQCVLDIK